MCGILGGNLFKDKEDLISSLKTISHRGRDNTDIKVFQNGMHLGHNRLSIQDLSPNSNQPFQSSCGRYYLVFNGELWKSTFDDWNDKLRKKYSFITDKSDTELLNKEQLHTRETTLSILGVSPKTLWNFQKDNLIKGTTFKGRRYYSKDAIIDCIKIHFNITTSTEFDSMWE